MASDARRDICLCQYMLSQLRFPVALFFLSAHMSPPFDRTIYPHISDISAGYLKFKGLCACVPKPPIARHRNRFKLSSRINPMTGRYRNMIFRLLSNMTDNVPATSKGSYPRGLTLYQECSIGGQNYMVLRDHAFV